MVGDDIQDDVCLIVDMECFYVHGRYHCREMGYCSWQGDSGRCAFRPSIPQQNLTIHERKHVRFLTRGIHGLSYDPDPREEIGFCPFQYVRNLYAEFTTDHRTRVAFKGGHIERDLLSHLHIPFLDLETLGCPKYNVLRQDEEEEEEEEETCGWHAIPNLHHCAMAECVAFFQWYRHYMDTFFDF